MGWGPCCAALLCASGCVIDVDYRDTTFRCDNGVCPGDLVCQTDGFCGDGVEEPDAGALDQVRGPGTWTTTAPSPLSARMWIDGLWTGTDFLIVGGATDAMFASTDSAARYNPDTDEWTEIAPIDIGGRHTVELIWTGTAALFWGGGAGNGAASGGSRYDPAADAWSPMSDVGGPGERIYGNTLWTGDRMLVWGGWDNDTDHVQTGFLYDPATDTWSPMSTAGAPSARSFASAVWAGDRAIVWGGCSGVMGECPDVIGDGAMYDPARDLWIPVSGDGAPSARSHHTAVWTGTDMLLFGGFTAGLSTPSPVNSGFIYNPETDSWRAISTEGAPSARGGSASAWLANEKMLIWGSALGHVSGFLYDPIDDLWSPMENTTDNPSPRSRFAHGVTDDNRLFIWGGDFTDVVGRVWAPEN